MNIKLKMWINTNDEQIFNDSIYRYFKYLAASICKRHKITKDIDIIINDLVSECSIKLPLQYKESKGTPKVLCFKIMNNYLLKQFRFNSQLKRNNKLTVYLEDIENQDEHTSSLIELEIDIFEYYKSTILDRTDILDKLETKLQKNIYNQIIKCLNDLPPSSNYIIYISKKCKCSLKSVYNSMDLIRNLLNRQDNYKILNLQESY